MNRLGEFKLLFANVKDYIKFAINNTYLQDYGIIYEVLDNNLVRVASLQKRNGTYKRLLCKYFTTRSNSLSVEIEPVKGDLVRIVSLQYLHKEMFDAEEPVDALDVKSYCQKHLICIPAGAYNEDREDKVKARFTQEDATVDSEVPVTIRVGEDLEVHLDPSGEISVNGTQIKIKVGEDSEVHLEQSGAVSVSGSQIKINGESKSFVTHEDLSAAVATFMVALNAHTHLAAGSETAPPAPLINFDISASATTTVKTGG